MGGEKRRGRRAWLDDFQETASGEYVYAGATHAYRTEGLTRRRALILLWTWAALSAGGLTGAGCVPAAGMQNCPYVVLPYAAALLAECSVVWLMCRLTAGGDPLRDYVYKATVGQFRLRGVLSLALRALTLAGDGVYLLLNGAGDRAGGTAAFWALTALSLCAGAGWLRTAGRLKWTP